MNCSRFRFLIQQWFDTPLSPQDERMVMAHLETCDSCARFQHQLDQVIQSTPEVPLPDECLPSNLEALAKRIMVEIPQEKPGFMGMLKGLFPFLGGGGNGSGSSNKAPKASKGAKKPKGGKQQQQPQQQQEMDEEAPVGSFPHVRRKPLEDAQPTVDPGRGRRSAAQQQQVDDDLLATSTRLKSLQKLQPMSEDPQAMTSSRLGHKFGVNLPDRDQQQDVAGVNLAESIRRKVAEPQQPSSDWGNSSGGYDDQTNSFGGGNQGGFDQQPFAGSGGGGFGSQPQPGGFGGAPPAFGQQQPPPFGGGSGSQPGMVGQWADSQSAPAPSAPSGGGWGDPPTPGVGGDSDWKPNPPASDWSIAKPQTSAWGGGQQAPGPQGQSGDSWGAQQSSGDWGNQQAQQQPQQQQPNNGWGAPQPAANDGWGAQPQAQPANDGWGGHQQQPAQPANDGWGAQPQPGQNQPGANNGWGDDGWNTTAPTTPALGGWQQGGPQPQNDGGWGAPQQPAQPAAQQGGGWGAPAAPNDGWGAPAPAANNNDGWGAPKPAGNDGWGAPQPQPAAANDGWGAPKQDSGGWGASAPAPTQGGGWGGGAQQESGWGTPAAPAPATDGGWSTPQAAPAAQQGGWGAPAQGGGGWGAPQATDGWSQPQAQANPYVTASPAPEAPKAPAAPEESWSEEGEQIQTGMWQAFTLDEPALGTPKGVNQSVAGARPQMPPPQPAQTEANRWDVPISERMKQAEPAPPQQPQMQAAPPPAQAAPPADRWDTPIQQRPPEAPAPAPQAPPPQPVAQAAPQGAPAQEGGLQNSIMDRLNSILGEDLTAMAGGNPPPVPGMQPAPQQQPQPQPQPQQQWAQPPQAPPPAPPVVQAAPEPPKPDTSQFDVPIQERMRQQAPEPAAAAAQSGLFNLDDRAIDNVFNSIGATDKVPAAAAAPAANMAAAPVPPAMPMAAPAAAPPVQTAAPAAPPPVRPPVAPPGAPPMAPPKISAVPPKLSAPNAAPVQPQPAPAPVQAAPPTPAPAQQQGQSGSMFKLDDSAMDKIFEQNLGVQDRPAAAQAPVQQPPVQQAPPPMPAPQAPNMRPPQPAQPPQAPPQQQYAPAPQQGMPAPQQPQPQAPMPQPAAPASKQSGQQGLFNVDDAAMDRIFNDLGVKEKPAAVPKINVREAVSQIRNLADVPAPAQVAGVGRLSKEDTSEPAAPGKINAIGKFLLDQQDLAKLGNLASSDLSDGKVRVLTHEASEEINKLLEHIATQPGVVGSVIVGHDGILIANSLPKEHDPETIGILSLGIYVNTTNIAKKIGHNHLHQLVSRTHHGYLVIADFGGGILVTVSNGQETDKLIPLMRSITQLVAQS